MTDAIKATKELLGFLYAAREEFYYLFICVASLMLIGYLIINYQKPEKRTRQFEKYMQSKRVEYGIEAPKKKIFSLKSIINYFF